MKKLVILVGIFGLIGCSSSSKKDFPHVAGIYQITKGSQTWTIDGVEEEPGCIVGSILGVYQSEDIVNFLDCMGNLKKDGNKWVVTCEGEIYDYSDYGVTYQTVTGEVIFEDELLSGTITHDMSYPQAGFKGVRVLKFNARFEPDVTSMCEN